MPFKESDHEEPATSLWAPAEDMEEVSLYICTVFFLEGVDH